ncbi:uncharacterized protein LOC141851341 isoform X2 [Brevipalpus obovatus]|uniref:uncharacterized protein LOC141851341 isoform X2 n=1 Tax=Brevipalpus obovatus TaxID=246614 RepID=UPI003D9F352E
MRAMGQSKRIGNMAKNDDDRYYEVAALGEQQWTHRESKKAKVLATEVFFRGNLLEMSEIKCPDSKVKGCGFTMEGSNKLKFPEEEGETDAGKQRRSKREKDPQMKCRFCQEIWSTQDNCIHHEQLYSVAPGSPNHSTPCDPSICGQNCSGKVFSYVPPPPKRRG